MPSLTRRNVIKLASMAAVGTALAPLGALNARTARAAGCSFASFTVPGFGPISPKLPVNSDDLLDVPGLGDLRSVALLELPEGFLYRAISIRGDLMDDGNQVPGDHDGMACFQGRGPTYVLIRNHELSPSEDEEGNNLGCLAENGQQYDPFIGTAAGLGGGGTTNVVVDKRDGSVVEHFISLGGTIRNCAGGPTPWNSWISCEENVDTPDNDDEVAFPHGYNFEVPAYLSEAVVPIALTAMGRFNHEAVAVDPRTHYIYQTEDRRDSIFFKYEPARRPTGFGDLQANDGKLFAMVIEPGQYADCDPTVSLPLNAFDPNFPELSAESFVDTRGERPIGRNNVVEGSGESILPFLGQELKVSWVELDDVDPVEDTLRYEALAKGATVWFRGEGAWEHKGLIYWVCSGAGDAGEGQVWIYDPKKETVKLVIESSEENLLDGPDNITVCSDGTLYLCEDGTGNSGDPTAPNFSQRVIGVDGDGGLFEFAKNILVNDDGTPNTTEFAGACFSPDHRFFFVNSQGGAGITWAIWREDNRPIHLEAGFVGRGKKS